MGLPKARILDHYYLSYNINDLPNASLSELKNIIKNELKNLPLAVEWFRANKLSLNANKSCYIVFSEANTNIDYLKTTIKIDGNNIGEVAISKFLGIHSDQYLTSGEHIKIISNKTAKNIGSGTCVKQNSSISSI